MFDCPEAASAATDASAAVVASSLETQPGVALACVAAGLAVLIEKPLALTAGDAQAVVEEAARRDLPALVVQNFRYLRWERAVMGALAGGSIGQPRSAEVDSARAAVWDFAIHHSTPTGSGTVDPRCPSRPARRPRSMWS
jgi:predicted dehydrogenase